MAPKKSKAQPPSSSQPLPQTRPQQRTRKRRASSEAESVASERPSSSQSGLASNPAKRPKRGRPAKNTSSQAEPEVIVEEDEQVTALDDQPALDPVDPSCAAPVDHDEVTEGAANETIEVAHPATTTTTTRHVHFGAEGEEEKSTATNITPHPRQKMAVKRRVTASPSFGMEGEGHGSKRFRTTSHRMSLPPTLSLGDRDAATVIQELQFAPLREVLEERVRRRLRRSHLSEELNDIEAHDRRDSRTQKELEELRVETAQKETRIRELALELESQRQRGIDMSDETEKTQEIAALKREVAGLKGSLVKRGEDVDMDMDDMLVLDSQEDHITYPQLPVEPETPMGNGQRSQTGVITTKQETNSQTIREPRMSMAVSQWDEERRRFEDAIMALSTEANDAKTALRILTIELQSLGFAGADATNEYVLESIRESFSSVRERLEMILPESMPDSASNSEILEILIANVQEFAERLRGQDKELVEKSSLVSDLSNQVNTLLNRLADSEIHLTKLEQQWKELDQSNENKERELDEIDDHLQKIQDERDDLQKELDENTTQYNDLQLENRDLTASVERLKESLEGYRAEETRLTQIITKMEKDHATTITMMNEEREKTVRELEEALDTEITHRGEAEKQSDERQATITELEIKIEELSKEREDLTGELVTVKTDLNTERDTRETLETNLEEKTVETENLETRVGRLEDELEDLTNQLETLRGMNESERNQREAAENDLDDRNVQIDELNKKLHAHGKEANELRSKLFEVQQKNTQQITALESAASERDEQYQSDIADEVARREAAEHLAKNHAATILELETKLIELEQTMRADLADRDARIRELETALDARDAEILDLQTSLTEAEKRLNDQLATSDELATTLRASITALETTITEHEATITSLHAAAETASNVHTNTIADRDASIVDLMAQATDLTAQVSELEIQKRGLERRVEQEAEQMLQLQNEKSIEIDALHATIRDKQDKILIVEDKARAADERWQEVLEARDEELETLKTATKTTSVGIEKLVQENADVKARFADYVRRSSGFIGNLQSQLRAFQAAAGADGDAVVAEGREALEAVEAMDAVGELRAMTTTTTTTTTTTSSSKASKKAVRKSGVLGAKGKKGKRMVDSGIGVEGEEEGDEGAWEAMGA
ncbi:hypothetical protein MBLNU230_g2595t1 [Neophaeotheca triangularis]